MSRFDEEPDGDPHGECAAEIAALKGEVARLREALKRAKEISDNALLTNSRDISDWQDDMVAIGDNSLAALARAEGDGNG